MGRLKKYNSKEEQQEAKRVAYRKYYWLNKEACDNKSRIRYKKKKDVSEVHKGSRLD